jgi:hypothetical protein
MRAAQWSEERVWHGGCRQGISSVDLPVFAAGCRASTGRGDSACASVKSLAVGRDGRRRRTAAAGSGKSRARIRRRKVLAVRHRIEQGSYDIDALLAIVFDKVLEDLITRVNTNSRHRSGNCTQTRASR